MFYVYELRDPNGKCFYVGKGKGRRMYEHRYRAKHGDMTHRACKIRKIWKAGLDFSAIKVFYSKIEEEVFIEERRLILLYGRENLTNKTDGGDGASNPTKEVREKIATMRRGRVASVETREKQRNAKLGKPCNKETRAKISAYQRGSKHPWAKQPQSLLATFKGRKHTPETIARMRAAKLGHAVNQSTRDKISASKRGLPAWNKGIPCSYEQKIKISLTKRKSRNGK
jgi:hypothetical protein